MAIDIETYPDLTDTPEANRDSFARYRALSDDDSNGVRKTGLFDPSLYDMALTDFRTVSVDEYGVAFPVFTPLKYVAGYDMPRCRELTDADSEEDCYYLNISPTVFARHGEEILERLSRNITPRDKLFFDYSDDDPEAAAIYERIVESLPYATAEVEFHNKGFSTQPGTASLSLFMARVTPRNTTEAPAPGEVSDMKTVFDKRVAAGKALARPSTGVTVLGPNEIDEELFGKMWKLYQSRFQWLGQAHPISMEDTEEEFRKMLYGSNTIVPISFKDGDSVCFADLFDNVDACGWLKPDVIRSYAEPGRRLWFFGGIVATADGIGGYSRGLIQLITELDAETGVPSTIVFESTDVSEGYIPDSVYKYVNDTGVSLCEQPRKVSQHRYRARTVIA